MKHIDKYGFLAICLVIAIWIAATVIFAVRAESLGGRVDILESRQQVPSVNIYDAKNVRIFTDVGSLEVITNGKAILWEKEEE